MALAWAGSGRWMGCCKGAAVTTPLSSLSSLAALVTAVQAALVIGAGSQGCGEGGDDDDAVVVFGGSCC